MRRGQVTLFVFLGVGLLLLVIIGYFLLSTATGEETPVVTDETNMLLAEETGLDADALSIRFQECHESIALDIKTKVLGYSVPHEGLEMITLIGEDINRLPEKEEIRDRMENLLERSLDGCLAGELATIEHTISSELRVDGATFGVRSTLVIPLSKGRYGEEALHAEPFPLNEYLQGFRSINDALFEEGDIDLAGVPETLLAEVELYSDEVVLVTLSKRDGSAEPMTLGFLVKEAVP